MRFTILGLGFRVEGLGFRVEVLGLRGQGLWFRVEVLGLRFWIIEFGVYPASAATRRLEPLSNSRLTTTAFSSPPPSRRMACVARTCREVDIRLHGKDNSNSHGAKPDFSNHPVDSDQ